MSFRVSFTIFTSAVAVSGVFTWILSMYFWYHYDHDNPVFAILYIVSGLQGVFFLGIANFVSLHSVLACTKDCAKNHVAMGKRSSDDHSR